MATTTTGSGAKRKVGEKGAAAAVNNQAFDSAVANEEKELDDNSKMNAEDDDQENRSLKRKTLEEIGGVAVKKQAVARANEKKDFGDDKMNVDDTDQEADQENRPLTHQFLKNIDGVMVKEQTPRERKPLQDIAGVVTKKGKTPEPHPGPSDKDRLSPFDFHTTQADEGETPEPQPGPSDEKGLEPFDFHSIQADDDDDDKKGKTPEPHPGPSDNKSLNPSEHRSIQADDDIDLDDILKFDIKDRVDFHDTATKTPRKFATTRDKDFDDDFEFRELNPFEIERFKENEIARALAEKKDKLSLDKLPAEIIFMILDHFDPNEREDRRILGVLRMSNKFINNTIKPILFQNLTVVVPKDEEESREGHKIGHMLKTFINDQSFRRVVKSVHISVEEGKAGLLIKEGLVKFAFTEEEHDVAHNRIDTIMCNRIWRFRTYKTYTHTDPKEPKIMCEHWHDILDNGCPDAAIALIFSFAQNATSLTISHYHIKEDAKEDWLKMRAFTETRRPGVIHYGRTMFSPFFAALNFRHPDSFPDSYFDKFEDASLSYDFQNIPVLTKVFVIKVGKLVKLAELLKEPVPDIEAQEKAEARQKILEEEKALLRAAVKAAEEEERKKAEALANEEPSIFAYFPPDEQWDGVNHVRHRRRRLQ